MSVLKRAINAIGLHPACRQRYLTEYFIFAPVISWGAQTKWLGLSCSLVQLIDLYCFSSIKIWQHRMKKYSKSCQWNEQMKSIMNLNRAMSYNLLPFIGLWIFFLCNVYIFLKREDKDKFKELLNSFSWAPIIVHLLLVHLSGEELGMVSVEEICALGVQFRTPSTLPGRIKSLGKHWRNWAQGLHCGYAQ